MKMMPVWLHWVSDLRWAGKTSPRLRRHGSSPQTQSMSRSLNVSGNKWQTGGVGGDEASAVCVSTGSTSSLLHPFTLLHHGAKKKKRGKKRFVCLCACMCVSSYPHKRLCILSALFILPFISTVLFSAHYLMSCQGLSCVGKKSAAQS